MALAAPRLTEDYLDILEGQGYVDHFQDDDAGPIVQMLRTRLGRLDPGWRPHEDELIAVVRDDLGVAGVLFYRISPDGTEIWADQIEGYREEAGKATVRGTRAIVALGRWMEHLGRRMGVKRIIAPVQFENRTHERALAKVGYTEFVHLWKKELSP